MAIAPNTTFTSGAVLTAAQMNALPWGIVAYTQSTNVVAVGTAVTLVTTASTFTAVANRYYKVTWIEPDMAPGGDDNRIDLQIRLTSTSGTLLQTMYTNNQQSATSDLGMICSWVGTLSAGSTVIVGCAKVTSDCNFFASSTEKRQIIVEDMGPA
jgi:hypothetical protein